MEKKKAYVVCPLCARNRAIESKEKGIVRWDFWNEDSLIIQIRNVSGGKKAGVKIGHGRGKAPGSGFPLIKDESLILDEAIKKDEYKKNFNEMKNQILKITKIFIEKKLIKKSDLKF